MEIRLIRHSELGKAAGIYKDAFNGSGFEERWTDETAKVFMEFLFEKQPDLFFIAEESGEIVGGIASVIKPFWNGPYISDLEIFIKPVTQSRGVGKLLLKRHLEEALKKHNVVTVDTTATRETEFPYSWYQRIGFKETSLMYISGDAREILNNLK